MNGSGRGRRWFLTGLLVVMLAAPAIANRWLQVETEHFRIIYDAGDAETAEELASFAEEVLTELSAYLGVTQERQIPVVIQGEAGDANGYFTYLPTRIVLYTATPSTPIVQPNLDEWLRIVFAHELTHYLQISQRIGISRLAGLFGPSFELVNLLFTPRWLAEGAAIVAETRLSDGGRGRSPVFEMQYVSALLAYDFWNFDQNFYNADFAPRSRVYVGGYVLSEYIIRTYGMERFMELTRSVLRHPLLGIRFAIRQVLYTSAGELYAALVEDLEETYGARRSIDGGRRLSPDDGGYWFLIRGSTDIYGASPTEYSRIYRADLWSDGITSRDSRGATEYSGDAFSMAAGDDFILATQGYTDEFRPDPSVGYTDLIRIDRESGAVSRITRGRRFYHPVLEPVSSGEHAYVIERTGSYSRLVKVSHISGDVDVEVIWAPPGTHMTAPAISPDGGLIAVAASRDGEQDIYLIDTRIGESQPVIRTSDVPEYFPVFVSDTKLWFTASPDGALALFEVDLESREVERLLTDPDGIFHAVPYGSGALYQSYSETGPTVKLAETLKREPADYTSSLSTMQPALPSESSADLQPSPYIDWPLPELWLPLILPSRAQAGLGLEYRGVALEMGGLLLAGSPLEQHLILLSAGVNSSTLVPSLSLEVMESIGPWQIGMTVSGAPSYIAEDGADAQYDATGSLSASRVIRSWGPGGYLLPGLRHSVSASSTVTYSALSVAGVQMSDFLSGAPDQAIVTSVGLSYRGSRQTRVADLLGPAGPGAAITVAAGLPFGGEPLFIVLAAASSRLPVGPAMFDGRVTLATADPALQVRLGIDSPALLVDEAVGAFNLTRLGVVAGVTQSVVFNGGSLAAALAADGDSPALQLQPATTATLELVARVGYLANSLTPAVGVSVTVPHELPLDPSYALTFRNTSSGSGIVIGQFVR